MSFNSTLTSPYFQTNDSQGVQGVQDVQYTENVQDLTEIQSISCFKNSEFNAPLLEKLNRIERSLITECRSGRYEDVIYILYIGLRKETDDHDFEPMCKIGISQYFLLQRHAAHKETFGSLTCHLVGLIPCKDARPVEKLLLRFFELTCRRRTLFVKLTSHREICKLDPDWDIQQLVKTVTDLRNLLGQQPVVKKIQNITLADQSKSLDHKFSDTDYTDDTSGNLNSTCLQSSLNAEIKRQNELMSPFVFDFAKYLYLPKD